MSINIELACEVRHIEHSRDPISVTSLFYDVCCLTSSKTSCHQALVHLLRKEGVQLGDKPIPPEDTVKLRPKRYGDQQVNFDELPEWVTYW